MVDETRMSASTRDTFDIGLIVLVKVYELRGELHRNLFFCGCRAQLTKFIGAPCEGVSLLCADDSVVGATTHILSFIVHKGID